MFIYPGSIEKWFAWRCNINIFSRKNIEKLLYAFMRSNCYVYSDFLLLTRYATANNPAIANAASNPGTPFSSGVA